jgi:peptide-methionine (R)-S-oxide reductase
MDELRKKVFHEGGTEAPFSGTYWNYDKDGNYCCASCGQVLFSSERKLDSSKGPQGLQGWPAFSDAQPGALRYEKDTKLGMERTEILCAHCGIHLGHVFFDVEGEGTQHFCVNSCALEFEDSK